MGWPASLSPKLITLNLSFSQAHSSSKATADTLSISSPSARSLAFIPPSPALSLFLTDAATFSLTSHLTSIYYFSNNIKEPDMAMNYIKSLKSLAIKKEVVGGVSGGRTFAAGAKKKGPKGGAADGPKTSSLSKEVKSTTLVSGNILKEGTDPKLLPDSEYPDWLWHLLDKKPALSELKRKKTEDLSYEDLKRFAKLDNRARIKENNSLRAKN